MQFCVCVLVCAFHTYKPPLWREPFSLAIVTRFLRGDRESGKHFCSPLVLIYLIILGFVTRCMTVIDTT